MDEQNPPTAAELGVSPGRYEQIMRDLQRRQASGPTALARAHPTGARPRPASTPPSASRAWLVVLGLIVGIVVVSRLVVTNSGPSQPVYAFMRTAGDHPVTYSSCRPVQVAVYPSGGPPNAEALVGEAVTQLRADTGLDISVIGSFGGHAPNWNFQVASVTAEDPISVSWQDQASLEGMTDDVAGLGGARGSPPRPEASATSPARSRSLSPTTPSSPSGATTTRSWRCCCTSSATSSAWPTCTRVPS